MEEMVMEHMDYDISETVSSVCTTLNFLRLKE